MKSGLPPEFEGLPTAVEPPPPVSGGTLAVLHDGVTVVVADADRDRVYVVDLGAPSGAKLKASIPLAAHDQPGRVVEDGAGRVHVVLRNGGGLATIDPVAGAVTMRRAICPLPRGLAYDAAADRLLVACAGGQLVTLSPTGATAERTIKLHEDLRDVVIDGPRVMVTRFRSAETIVLDSQGAVMEVIKPVAFKNNSPLQASPSTFAPAVAWRTVAMPDGGAMMIHQRGMDGQVHETPGGYGGLSPCDTIVHTAVTRMKSGERPHPGPAMPGFVLPVDVAVSGDGRKVAMVAAGNGHALFGMRKLFVADVDDVTKEWEGGCGMDDKHGPAIAPICPTPGPSSGMTMGNPAVAGAGGASGFAFDAGTGSGAGASTGTGAGGTAPCYGDIPGNVEPISVGFAGPERVVVQTREPAQLWIVSPVTGTPEMVALSQESRADLGHTVFHSNSGGGLACASCHPEGHEDGRVWVFDCEGRRRTQDISGGLGGTEPFHWNGDLPDFSALVDTVFVRRMSGPQLTRDKVMAALGWINSVPVRPSLRAGTDPSAQHGKVIFESAAVGCSACHLGKSLTNNATVDVGTSALFQVPSLRGVAWRAPFMHDGCAPTLAARFGNKFCDGGDAHGKTSQLKPTEIDDLVAYLESL